jgi:hypothetical protein
MPIGTRLVFLQDQPPGPLIGVDRRDTPMPRSRRLVIRSDSAARQDGLAARPRAEGSSLDCFETLVSRVQVYRVSGRFSDSSPGMLGNFRVDRCPGRFCSQLPTGHTSAPLSSTAQPHHDDGQGQPGFGAGSCRRRTKVTTCYCRSQECSPFYSIRSCERTRIH